MKYIRIGRREAVCERAEGAVIANRSQGEPQDGTTEGRRCAALAVGKLDGHRKRLPATVVRVPFYDPDKIRVRA